MLTKHASKTISLIKNSLLKERIIVQAAKMSSGPQTYETLSVTVPKEFVYHVELNRPKKMNAINQAMWEDIGKCFNDLDYDEDCRVVVLSGAGKLFCAGIDLIDAAEMGSKLVDKNDVVRRAKVLKQICSKYQNSMTSLEICRKPVLVAVHSGCIGAGVDLITAGDMRYCTEDAWFQVKEVDVGMAADTGTLQRLPKVVGNDSVARDLCYTARKLGAQEAQTLGLVSKVFQDKDQMIKEVIEIATVIASKSPVAIQGTKSNLIYSRDHTVQEGLDHITAWNQMALQSEDFQEATVAAATKNTNIVFSKL